MAREKILIVDDSEMNRSILMDMLEDDYEILEAENGLEAIHILQERRKEIALILLDIVMPVMNGFGVLDAMNTNDWIGDTPVIMVTAETDPAQVEKAFEQGVTDFITRPFDAYIVRRRVQNTVLLYAKQKKLISLVEEQIYEKEQRSSMMIDILSHIVEFRNGESGLHILHVRAITDYLLHRLRLQTDKYPLDEEDITLISTAAALHDIGKIAIDEKILNKPGRLTDEEFQIMKTHSLIGANMLEGISFRQDNGLIRVAYEICRWHHERYDGRGYPDGLTGEQIPISAQVVALADVYDALTSERVYKKALPHEKALEMILDGQCGAFNPLLLACLKENETGLWKTVNRSESELSEHISEHTRIRNLTETIKHERGAGVSDRTARLIDYERMKHTFFAEMTEEIQFEYTAEPSTLTLSAWGAQRLGLEEVINNPRDNERIRQLLGPGIWDVISNELHKTTPQDPEIRGEYQMRVDQRPRWFRVIIRAIWSKDIPGFFEGAIGKAIDIHSMRMEMEMLENRATKDWLTGLHNRASAVEQINKRLQIRPEGRYALAIFDIDDFKSFNDTYGHQFGDKVLQQVGERLDHSVRGSDITCRAGGDEFMLCLEYNTDIERTIDRIFHTLCWQIDGVDVSVSMGVALTKDIGLTYEQLFRAADVALYASKQAGKARYTFYHPSMSGEGASLSQIDEKGEER